MSVSASIDVSVPGLGSGSKVTDLIQALLSAGWSYDDHGHVSYLPVGDRDSFDWRQVGVERWSDIVDIIRQKEQLGELIGVVLVWANAGPGGEFLVDATNGVLMVSLTVERRVAEAAPEVTDFTWYLERIVPAVSKAGLLVESVKCSQG